MKNLRTDIQGGYHLNGISLHDSERSNTEEYNHRTAEAADYLCPRLGGHVHPRNYPKHSLRLD
jgi:hypothetical protein